MGRGREGDTSGEEGGIGRLERTASPAERRHHRANERGTAERKAVTLVEAGNVTSGRKNMIHCVVRIPIEIVAG